jgi:Acyl-CoA reductase (LuxC)
MISLQARIQLLDRLGKYMLSDDAAWLEAQQRAMQSNAWFTQEHIHSAIINIAQQFLQADKLNQWVANYPTVQHPLKVGIVMAGNIPLVGFHDFLCGFVSGHILYIKLSSKDEVLMKHLIHLLITWEPEVADVVIIAERLNGCDAYIATGSNNTARYFEQYFGAYPHIIRRNRTSVAILDGTETDEQINQLADDVFMFFGLGCRNVTQVHIPQGYELSRLLSQFESHKEIIHHNKYKNNYDYYLAIYMLNKVPFYTNDSILMVENNSPFSAVSVLHYAYYDDIHALETQLSTNTDIQCIVGNGHTPFGRAQVPSLANYADGVDTMQFLTSL